MKIFMNFSTRTKLVVGFGVILLMLVIVVLIAYRGLTEITLSEKELYDDHFQIALELRELRSHQNFNRGQILEMMLSTKKSDWDKIEQTVNERSQAIDTIMQKLLKLDPNPQFQSRLNELKSMMAIYRQTRMEEIALIRHGKKEESRQLGLSLQNDRFEKIRSIATELGDKVANEAEDQLTLDQQQAQSSIRLFAIIGVVALLLSIGMISILNRIMSKPLSQLTDTAENIAAGDLNVTLATEKRLDEVGLLTQSFSRMVRSLRDMAGVAERIAAGDLRDEIKPQSEKDLLGNSFARMTENLRRSTTDISEAVNLLGSSASEILAAATQVASGTAETASSISETTTTVEEVRHAAQLSSQKAKAVSDNAQNVAQISQSGQKAVDEAAAGMRQIRTQMESIAQTIVRLSEQSQSIAGIIASVTDIADQSNLLAVNAAIEAAKAGEQGKGFAVVAQEIKSLAEQSKHATAEVRAILNDVQKATSAAVMATEQGSKAVEMGVKQSAQAGEAIRELAATSKEATQASSQIVASSQQQAVGMDQIGIAMENINQAGAQNAASMRQAETAAKSLHELGQKLKQLVEHFKV